MVGHTPGAGAEFAVRWFLLDDRYPVHVRRREREVRRRFPGISSIICCIITHGGLVENGIYIYEAAWSTRRCILFVK